MSNRHSVLSLSTALIALCACAPQNKVQNDLTNVTLYPATILTMNADMPTASAVAVRNGSITAVGDFKALKALLTGATIDTRFSDKTLMPGLIDPHVHMTLGAMMYALPFVPPWDMQTHEGTIKGLPNKESFLARVKDLSDASPEGPLVLFGYHNLVHGDLTRQDLDGIVSNRPLFIWHYSGHDFYLNSQAITLSKLTPALANQYHGVDLDADGELTGRIYEDAGLALFATLGPILLGPENIARGFNGFEALLKRSGVTTVAEMGYGIFGLETENAYLDAFYDDTDAYRLYLVPELRAFKKAYGDNVSSEIFKQVKDTSKRRRVLPQIKLFTDAAFYSQTMKLNAPGYTGGQSKGTEGLWVIEPDQLAGVMQNSWDAGLDIHIHSNGDAAQNSTLSAFAQIKDGAQTDTQRLIIEHAGLLTPDHIKKASELGVGLSAASHYVNYMGGLYAEAIGERVQYITPLRSAIEAGMKTTLHSDAPLAPPQPLRAASVHVTRMTREGTVSTPSERLTKNQALRAVTLDAAWSLGLETEIGSIETGKKADFTVLDANPMEMNAQDWPEIKVSGVLIDGVIYPVEE